MIHGLLHLDFSAFILEGAFIDKKKSDVSDLMVKFRGCCLNLSASQSCTPPCQPLAMQCMSFDVWVLGAMCKSNPNLVGILQDFRRMFENSVSEHEFFAN